MFCLWCCKGSLGGTSRLTGWGLESVFYSPGLLFLVPSPHLGRTSGQIPCSHSCSFFWAVPSPWNTIPAPFPFFETQGGPPIKAQRQAQDICRAYLTTLTPLPCPAQPCAICTSRGGEKGVTQHVLWYCTDGLLFSPAWSRMSLPHRVTSQLPPTLLAHTVRAPISGLSQHESSSEDPIRGF